MQTDWQWAFEKGIDWEQTLPLYGKKADKENLDELCEFMQALDSWSKDSVAPRSERLHKEGGGEVKDGWAVPSPALQELLDEAKELGFHAISGSPEVGGLGLPSSLTMMGYYFLARGCQSSASQLPFYAAIADMLERFGDDDLKAEWCPKLYAGEVSGAMALTEPGHGSDLGGIRTSAKKIQDREYEINGTKIFITNGGGEGHLVLARTQGAPEGLEGISLFFCPKVRADGSLNHVVTKLEEKLGQHASHTCEVLYEKAEGRLLGEENHGLKLMFHLMNEARIGVGMQCLGAMEGIFNYVRQYAEEREQFGRRLIDLPLYRRNMKERYAELEGFRHLMMSTAGHFDVYQHLHLKEIQTGDLGQEEREQYKEASKWVRRRTPLVKFLGTEALLRTASWGVKALGGHGFMLDHPVGRWMNDSYGPSLYEGTSQIQALMALKDLMKYVLKNPARYFQTMVTGHPLGNLIGGSEEREREFGQFQYEFKKNFGALLVKVMRPSGGDLISMFKGMGVPQEEKIDALMAHAEGVCEGLAQIEVLRVLSQLSVKHEHLNELFDDCLRLAQSKMASVYSDWKNV